MEDFPPTHLPSSRKNLETNHRTFEYPTNTIERTFLSTHTRTALHLGSENVIPVYLLAPRSATRHPHVYSLPGLKGNTSKYGDLCISRGPTLTGWRDEGVGGLRPIHERHFLWTPISIMGTRFTLPDYAGGGRPDQRQLVLVVSTVAKLQKEAARAEALKGRDKLRSVVGPAAEAEAGNARLAQEVEALRCEHNDLQRKVDAYDAAKTVRSKIEEPSKIQLVCWCRTPR